MESRTLEAQGIGAECDVPNVSWLKEVIQLDQAVS